MSLPRHINPAFKPSPKSWTLTPPHPKPDPNPPPQMFEDFLPPLAKLSWASLSVSVERGGDGGGVELKTAAADGQLLSPKPLTTQPLDPEP